MSEDKPIVRMMGEVLRSDLDRFEGWTLVVVSGEILVDNFRPSNVRFQMRSPDGKEHVNIYVEDGDDEDMDGLMFFIRPAQDHQRRCGKRLGDTLLWCDDEAGHSGEHHSRVAASPS